MFVFIKTDRKTNSKAWFVSLIKSFLFFLFFFFKHMNNWPVQWTWLSDRQIDRHTDRQRKQQKLKLHFNVLRRYIKQLELVHAYFTVSLALMLFKLRLIFEIQNYFKIWVIKTRHYQIIYVHLKIFYFFMENFLFHIVFSLFFKKKFFFFWSLKLHVMFLKWHEFCFPFCFKCSWAKPCTLKKKIT